MPLETLGAYHSFTHLFFFQRGHKKADVTNELLSPADMAKRTVKINFGERLGATTDSLVPRVLRDELKANNGAILESEFVCAMVRRDPKVTILGTHYLFRKYVVSIPRQSFRNTDQILMTILLVGVSASPSG